ncbi:uncharacterized protein LOC114751324 [Neltuma alba]|uniref:uncharacterized protein LOC114751324 n=1 Tax=Neltuma alba TaxID=207710 RepID=UPI0010A3BC4C|nr:uncharacterized protein LOC114751324 [Prosopis alba]
MEVLAPQQLKVANEVKKRTQCPGIRVIGGRIYDSENGVCCHQCRQKTRDFAAWCKNLKGEKLCTIKFCHKCLLNRYGEKAEEVNVLNDWKCPRCRGICNCSLCMKRRGHQPTGQLVKTAKASGFSSVSEMLDVKGPDNITSANIPNVVVSPIKAISSKKDLMIDLNISNSDMEVKSNAVSPKMPCGSGKELVVALSPKHGKENSLDRNSGLNSQKALPNSKKRPKKTKREGLKEIRNGSRVNDACQNGSTKKVKTYNEVPSEETKQNATEDIIQAGKKRNKMKQRMKVSRTSNDVSLNSDENDVKEEMNKQNCEDGVNPQNKEMNKVISLPPGSLLTSILDLELPPEDVGHALQFLEFCTAFEKILDMKKGEAEAILEELICIQSAPTRHKTLVVQFYIRLLTLILSESGDGSPSLKSLSGKHSWWEALRNIISESDVVPKALQLDSLEEGIDGYYNLNLSNKLKLLNFLCDEALDTETIRSFIDEQHSKFAESAKEAKIKVAAAKEKERSLKQKMKDDVARAIIANNGAPLSISEHEGLVREIKSEAARAHAKMLEAKGLIPKMKQRSDAVRTEPVLLDGCGRAFWRLKCYTDEYAVLLQEIEFQDKDAAAAADERWFVYGTEQKHDIEAYISSRAKRPRI